MSREHPYTHDRILQIMPADGWWIVWAARDSTYFRGRIVAFALIEIWCSASADATEFPGPDSWDIEREVKPIVDHANGYVTVCEDENVIAVVHKDEWTEKQSDIESAASAYAADVAERSKPVASPPGAGE